MPKVFQLPLQVAGIPAECRVKILAANSSDQPLDKGMRQRYARNGFDLFDIQNTKIRLPAVVLEYLGSKWQC